MINFQANSSLSGDNFITLSLWDEGGREVRLAHEGKVGSLLKGKVTFFWVDREWDRTIFLAFLSDDR